MVNFMTDEKVDRRINVLLNDHIVKQRLKVYCALNNKNIKEVVEIALKEFLDKKDKENY